MDKEARTFPKEGTARPLGGQGPLQEAELWRREPTEIWQELLGWGEGWGSEWESVAESKE